MPRTVVLTLILSILTVFIIRAQEIRLPAQKAVMIPLPEKRPEYKKPRKENVPSKQKAEIKPLGKFIEDEVKWKTIVAIPLPTRDPRKNTLGDEEVTEWPVVDIVKAQELCSKILKGIPVTYDKILPVRKGRCGTPAPILLKSIGKNPVVTISPPAKTNCQIARALYTWLKNKAQPQARKIFKSPIVSIENIASYSCRTRYGNPLKRISEHAFANALDIAGFTTAKGEKISLLKDWGPTERDIIAARRKKNRERKDLFLSLVKTHAKLHAKNKLVKISELKKQSKSDITTGTIKQLEFKFKLYVPLPVRRSEFLSGPTLDKKGKFLHKIHSGACGIFGTVLGPEANDAHRNHFHFDLAPRKYGPFCE